MSYELIAAAANRAANFRGVSGAEAPRFEIVRGGVYAAGGEIPSGIFSLQV